MTDNHLRPHSSLQEVLGALTTTGPGRMQIIIDAINRGDFRDARLVEAAVNGLDDPSKEIAELLVEYVMPLYGIEILPLLRQRFNVKGNAGDVRKLNLMQTLDPSGSREFIKLSLDCGSKQIKQAAIRFLGDSPENIPLLIKQSKARARDVRYAALKALSQFNAPEAATELCQIIEKLDELRLYDAIIWHNQQREVLDCLLNQIRRQFGIALNEKLKSKAKKDHALNALLELLFCLSHRPDRGHPEVILLLLEYYAQLDRIKEIKAQTSPTFLVDGLLHALKSCRKAQGASSESS